MPHYAVSADGVRFIARFEGFLDRPVPLQDGRFLVGHGAASAAARSVGPEDALDALRADLDALMRAMNAALPDGLGQAQIDALASFGHSIGWDAFAGSEVLRRVQSGDHAAAAMAMLAWRKSSVLGDSAVVEPLVRRRIAEQALYLSDAPAGAAPSLWLQPEIDPSCAVLGAPVASAPAFLPNSDDAEEPLLLTVLADDAPRARAGRGDWAAIAVVAALSCAALAMAGAFFMSDAAAAADTPAGAALAVLGLAGLAVAAWHAQQPR
ncbi:MAG: hypothetical protein GC189_06385 [Alphaproteobacteria bacterium]|nr:hypothetical protein [Alphaproteobacteria bacterium]